MALQRSRGQIQNAITTALVHFHAEWTGHGPNEARCYIVDDMVIVRFKGALSRMERRLAEQAEGRRLVKAMRQILREGCRSELEAIVARETGAQVISYHSDVSTRTGERIEIYVLDRNLDRELRRRDDGPEGSP